MAEIKFGEGKKGKRGSNVLQKVKPLFHGLKNHKMIKFLYDVCVTLHHKRKETLASALHK